VWRGLAEFSEKYIKKGSQLFIEGKIKTRSYDDKTGNKRYITEIYGDTVQLLGKREASDNAGTPNQPMANQEPVVNATPFDGAPADAADDLPF